MPSNTQAISCPKHGFIAETSSNAGVYCGKCKAWVKKDTRKKIKEVRV